MSNPKTFGELFGECVRKKREAQNISISDVHKVTGIGLSYISQLELGKTKNPQPSTIIKMSRAVGFSDDEIEFFKVGQMPPNNALQIKPDISFEMALEKLLPDSLIRKSFVTSAEGSGHSTKDFAKLVLTAAATNRWKPPSR